MQVHCGTSRFEYFFHLCWQLRCGSLFGQCCDLSHRFSCNFYLNNGWIEALLHIQVTWLSYYGLGEKGAGVWDNGPVWREKECRVIVVSLSLWSSNPLLISLHMENYFLCYTQSFINKCYWEYLYNFHLTTLISHCSFTSYFSLNHPNKLSCWPRCRQVVS